MWNSTSVYLSLHTRCYCCKIPALWPYCTCWSAHMCRATIKGHIQNSRRLHSILQLLKLNIGRSSLTSFTYVNSPPAKGNFIKLWLPFFSFLTSGVQRSRGSVSGDREDYGCRHSIGSHYCPQSAPGTLSPLFFSSSVFLSLLSLVLWQTKRQLVSH